MTTYPSREHENADKAARRRAEAALAELAGEAALLRRALKDGHKLDGDDTQRLADLVRSATVNLSVLGTLRDVREWHAADQAEAKVTEARA